MDMILGLSVNLNIVSLFSVTYVVSTHYNCLIEAILMCASTCLSINKTFHHKLFLSNSQLLSLFH